MECNVNEWGKYEVWKKGGRRNEVTMCNDQNWLRGKKEEIKIIKLFKSD